MIFQSSLGIDIAEHELCLVFLKATTRDVRLAAYDVYPIEEGLQDDEKARAISSLVEGFIRKNRISAASVFAGVPRDKVILRYLDYPFAVKENLRETLGYELEKYVPFNPSDIYFDFQVIREDKSTDRLRLILVVVKKQVLSPILAVSKALGFSISGVGVTGLAMADYFSWQSKRAGAQTISFVYGRGSNVELGLVRNGILQYSRNFERKDGIGEAILGALSKLREDFATNNETLKTILLGIERDGPLANRLGDIEGISFHTDQSSVQMPSARLVPAFGLALKGVRNTSMDINLLPVDLRKKPSKLKYYTLIGLLLLGFLAVTAWAGGLFLQHQWTLEQLEGEIENLSVQLRKVDQIKSEIMKLEGRIAYLNSVRQGGLPVLDTLRELSERIPNDAWVRRFDMSEKGVQIEGEATSASELIQILEASPIFSDVTFLSAITKIRDGKERFRIGLNVK